MSSISNKPIMVHDSHVIIIQPRPLVTRVTTTNSFAVVIMLCMVSVNIATLVYACGASAQHPQASEPVTVQQGATTTLVVQPATPSQPSVPAPSVTPWGVFGGGPQDQDNSYDFDSSRSAQTQTVRGEKNAWYAVPGLGADRISGLMPEYHVVRRGDTLWDLCDLYYSDPYEWPRVWALNPQIENPHWIYPGERLRMTDQPGGRYQQTQHSDAQGSSRLRLRFGYRGYGAGHAGFNAVSVPNVGFVGAVSNDVWGKLVGSPTDQMLLSDGDEVYLQMYGNRRPKVGQRFSILHNARLLEGGGSGQQVVSVKGTGTIINYNDTTKIATMQINESLDVIERGDIITPEKKMIEVVAVTANQVELWAKIMEAAAPRELVAQHQIVFINKGAKDGLKPGNRLFAVGTGNRWEQSLKTAGPMAASQVKYRLKSAKIEQTPRGTAKLPTQVIGEVRVVSVHKNTAVCIVTRSDYELQPGQDLLARKGY